MQIDAIHIDRLLSFDKFTWNGLDPHLNVIVGPNGVGKTNLFSALRAVRDALTTEQPQTHAHWAGAGYRGRDADTITVALDLQFTTDKEQDMLSTFLAAVLCNQQEMQQRVGETVHRNLDADGLRRFSTWVHEQLQPADISWFFCGRLTVTYVGRWGWQCRYESMPGAPEFRLDLTNGGTLVGHAEYTPQTATQNWGPLFVVWRNSLTEQERLQLDNGLTGATPNVDFPELHFSRLLDWVASQQGVALQLGDQMQVVDPTTLATYRAFASATQIPSDSRGFLGIRFVFQRLFEQALIFTDNVRLPHQYLFSTEELFTQPVDLSSGEDLARFLFRKKNGNLRDREQFTAIQGLFSRMTGRQFDVDFGPTNAGVLPPEPSDLSLGLVTSSLWGDMPLESSGAGIAEALFLSAVLAGSTGQVVLLDEPALNLHPTMQATLLDELLALAHQSEDRGSQFLMNTHTPTLVPPDAIDRVSRFTLEAGQHTIRRAVNVGEIGRDILDDLRRKLRGDLAARALLFSRAVLLLEGETELGALPVWFPDLVRQDIALYAVGGKGNFVSPLKLLYHFAIPWAIIGDGEVLWDLKQQGSSPDPQGHIRAILALLDQPLSITLDDPGSNTKAFIQWRQDLEAHGIFTLASSAKEGFEKAIKNDIPAELWKKTDAQFGSNKVARGRFIAESHECPKKVDELIQRALDYLRIQGADIRHATRERLQSDCLRP